MAGTGGIGPATATTAATAGFGGGWVGPAIGAAGSILGGVFGGSNDRSHEQEKLAKKMYKRAITWRVNDAKRAGIHPLYALGAAAPSAPQLIPGQSNMGSAVKDAAHFVADAIQNRRLQKAQIGLIEAQTRVADAEAARVMGTTNPSPGSPRVEIGLPSQPYVTEPGTGYTRTHPDSAIGAEEVIGPWIDRWLHGTDQQKMEIEQKAYNSLKRAFQRQHEWNPGRKAAEYIRRRFSEAWDSARRQQKNYNFQHFGR